jgi:hypothetical protein
MWGQMQDAHTVHTVSNINYDSLQINMNINDCGMFHGLLGNCKLSWYIANIKNVFKQYVAFLLKMILFNSFKKLQIVYYANK